MKIDPLHSPGKAFLFCLQVQAGKLQRQLTWYRQSACSCLQMETQFLRLLVDQFGKFQKISSWFDPENPLMDVQNDSERVPMILVQIMLEREVPYTLQQRTELLELKRRSLYSLPSQEEIFASKCIHLIPLHLGPPKFQTINSISF